MSLVAARGPLTVEELSESAETERELGITRIVCAPSDIAEDEGETLAVAYVVRVEDASLFATALDLLAEAEECLRFVSEVAVTTGSEEVRRDAWRRQRALRAVIARAGGLPL